MKRRCCFLSAASSQQILCTNASNRLFCVCFYSLCVTTISRMKQAHLSFNKMKMKNQFSIHFPFRPFSNVFHLYFFSFVRSFARWLLLILFYFYCLVVFLRSHFCVTERKHECVCLYMWRFGSSEEESSAKEELELDWIGLGGPSYIYIYTWFVTFMLLESASSAKANGRAFAHGHVLLE